MRSPHAIELPAAELPLIAALVEHERAAAALLDDDGRPLTAAEREALQRALVWVGPAAETGAGAGHGDHAAARAARPTGEAAPRSEQEAAWFIASDEAGTSTAASRQP